MKYDWEVSGSKLPHLYISRSMPYESKFSRYIETLKSRIMVYDENIKTKVFLKICVDKKYNIK
mgnify:CR=1 FL=1